MKTSRRVIIFCVFIQLVVASCTKKIPLHASFDKHVYRKANTARFAFYLSKKSKESIRLMNMVRMNGPLFAKTYYIDYLLEDSIIKSRADTLSMMHFPHHASLYSDLIRLKKLPLLRPSFSLHLPASFHAMTSGISGYTGHDKPFRFEVRIKIFGNLNNNIGENCDYGNSSAFEAVMSLLIDESVTGVGHRRNILNKNFRRIGCSFKYHKRYGCNYVQDFSTGNLFQRIF